MVYEKKSLADKFISGGFGYGSLCIPNKIIDLILIIIFPPMFVILFQVTQYKKALSKDPSAKMLDYIDVGQITMSFILTSLFYFPGFIHALNIKNKQACGSVL